MATTPEPPVPPLLVCATTMFVSLPLMYGAAAAVMRPVPSSVLVGVVGTVYSHSRTGFAGSVISIA